MVPVTTEAIPTSVVVVRTCDVLDCDSPRSDGIDEDHVRVLAATDEKLPPILVHYETMRVIDGMHRLAAARLNGVPEINVRYFFGSCDEAFRMGVRANIAHGLPLSLADRRSAAVRILESHPQLSNRSIAHETGLSAKTVAAIRARTAVGADNATIRIGKDGRLRPLNLTAGRLAASDLIARRPDASLREIAREAGISVGTARDVRLRILAGQDPLPTPREPDREASTGRASTREQRIREHGVSPAGVVDSDQVIHALRRDPSLRHSDSGRALLRWLDSRKVTVDQWRENSETIPPHCREMVGKLAREFSRVWMRLAEEIDATTTRPE